MLKYSSCYLLLLLLLSFLLLLLVSKYAWTYMSFLYFDPHIVLTWSVASHAPLHGNLFINLYLILGNLMIYPFELDCLWLVSQIRPFTQPLCWGDLKLSLYVFHSLKMWLKFGALTWFLLSLIVVGWLTWFRWTYLQAVSVVNIVLLAGMKMLQSR